MSSYILTRSCPAPGCWEKTSQEYDTVEERDALMLNGPWRCPRHSDVTALSRDQLDRLDALTKAETFTVEEDILPLLDALPALLLAAREAANLRAENETLWGFYDAWKALTDSEQGDPQADEKFDCWTAALAVIEALAAARETATRETT